MTALPSLTLVIPVRRQDEGHLQRLLGSLDTQDYPKAQLEVLLISKGNSEEAKAIGISRARGDIIGLLCTDNVLIGSDFLTTMVQAASHPSVVGAYTAQYHYEPRDTLLNRYFALLGANDPVCWWLGKADRQSYLRPTRQALSLHAFNGSIPSLGDNGCFYKHAALKRVVQDPKAFGSCMCICEDLRRLGYATWAITPNTIWHRTGASWATYLQKRWRYVHELYWDRYHMRRWRMVSTPGEYLRVMLFGMASCLVVPHLWTACRGYWHRRDPAWFLHPLACLALTVLYAVAWALQVPKRLKP